ncbi:MAG: GumC family protein [Sphingobacterium composti]|uniref:GumC family protein n=1 Tax=Sphingobacterium composti TaxID=363260 RepID=UPI00135AEF4C|nr:polysaccharide biosynthesis tyrosine autokinase [Sphingobacterium composti Ten et al. 2007 non Yoo et al. 2007]
MFAEKKLNRANGFAETMDRYIKNWPYFLISIFIALGLVYGFIYITPSTYKITSTLLIQDDKNGSAMSNSTAFSDLNMFQTVKTVDNEIEILRSRDLISQVLTELDFQTTYFQKSGLKNTELYGQTLPIKVEIQELKKGAYARKIEITPINDTQFRLTDSTLNLVVGYNQLIENKNYSIKVNKGPAFSKDFGTINIQFKDLYKLTETYSLLKLKIIPVVKDANTVVISLNDNVPQRGVDFLTHLIEKYNINNVNNKNIIAENTIKFIDNRLKYLTNDLVGAEQDVENFKRQYELTDINIDAQINAARSVEYNQLLGESVTQLNLVKSLESYFRDNQSPGSLAPSAMGIQDPILNGMIAKFNDIQQERNRMLRTANPENPLVINLDNQLSNLRGNILENLKSVRNRFDIERNNFQKNYAQYNRKSKSVPTIERGLLEKSREQTVMSTLYQYLLQKREETALSLSTTVPTSQIVDKPAYNTTPIAPKVPMLYLFGFFVGMFVPAGIIYARGFFNNKVRDARSIELTGARLLGELSHNLDNNTNVFKADRRSTISELFRYIRMNLGFMVNQKHKVILVTSSMKGEGKTFFSINLATTLGMQNKKVVILEFDLRRPALLKKLNLPTTVGITEYLNDDQLSIDELIQPSFLSDNVSVIGCGNIPENPAEDMMNPKISILIEELKERFDYIIIDTSPVGQVADAFSLAPYTDVSIYLVRYNYTNNYQLAILKDINDENKFKNLLVVFNDAKRDKSQKYTYGGYGYAMQD